MVSRFDAILDRRRVRRQAVARERADAALAGLRAEGIGAVVIGSLARGDFGVHSDVDFVLNPPAGQELHALTVLARHMGEFPYSVVFLNNVPPPRIALMLEPVHDTSGLRTGPVEVARPDP